MRFYGYTTTEHPGGVIVPPPPRTFESLNDALEKFEAEAKEFFKIESRPITLWLYQGEPDGHEERLGYPDFPDHVFRALCNDFEQDIQIYEEIV